jgi:hypothetical protein
MHASLICCGAQVEAEGKERWYASDSPDAYARGMVRQGSSNPCSPVNADVVGGEERLAELEAAVVEAIVSRVTAEGRWEAGKGVRSPYTVLHVLAAL